MNALIAYFSYTGHTKGIAQQMRDITGGTLFEIRPATPPMTRRLRHHRAAGPQGNP